MVSRWTPGDGQRTSLNANIVPRSGRFFGGASRSCNTKERAPDEFRKARRRRRRRENIKSCHRRLSTSHISPPLPRRRFTRFLHLPHFGRLLVTPVRSSRSLALSLSLSLSISLHLSFARHLSSFFAVYVYVHINVHTHTHSEPKCFRR